MGTRVSDSLQYRHLWGTEESRAVFDERARLQSWLTILVALAAAQARVGVIPTRAASEISRHARVEDLDLDLIAAETRSTSHSTIGLIHALQQQLPQHAREYVYYGATVQDLTDTWFALVIRQIGRIVWRDLRALEEQLLVTAHQHRDTAMAGRTHGQPGAPITFGFKAAGWADELSRHLQRLEEGRPRWLVAQLGGAVGVLGFFDPDGIRLRHEFCAELGLGEPRISWLTARDRVAEFGSLLAMICTTLARIGNEVYELSRPEIGELHEADNPEAVGSITMPHKHNPESSEHLDTLARLARAGAAVLVEGMSGSHERDGRSWKAEWVALPEVCQLTTVALSTARALVGGLQVDTAAINDNLARFGPQLTSERILAGLSRELGKHRAQQAMHDLNTAGGADLGSRLVAAGLATPAQLRSWTDGPALTAAGQMTDAVIAAARTARSTETDRWGA